MKNINKKDILDKDWNSVYSEYNLLSKIVEEFGIENRGCLSLSPDRSHPNNFSTLLDSIRNHGATTVDAAILFLLFEPWVESIKYNYPENIFCDFDYIFFELFDELQKMNDFHIEEQNSNIQNFRENQQRIFDSKINYTLDFKDQILRIMDIFGAHSSIQFRYVHDFLYGFDWCKWIRKKKQSLSKTIPKPFGKEFLTYIENRGLEIHRMIQTNDKDYVPLEKGRFRNPFVYVRDSDEEIMLMGSLARSKEIPVVSWEANGIYSADKDYSMIRRNRANELGIAPNRMPGAHKIT